MALYIGSTNITIQDICKNIEKFPKNNRILGKRYLHFFLGYWLCLGCEEIQMWVITMMAKEIVSSELELDKVNRITIDFATL